MSRQSTHECGKVISPNHRTPIPKEVIQVLVPVRGWVSSIVRLEGLCQWKIPVTPSGIEPATFRLAAQCLKQLRYRVSHIMVFLVDKVVICQVFSSLFFLLHTFYLFSTAPLYSLVRAYYNGLPNEVLIIRPNKTYRSNKIIFYYTLNVSADQISNRQVDVSFIVYPTSTETYCSV